MVSGYLISKLDEMMIFSKQKTQTMNTTEEENGVVALQGCDFKID